MKFVKENLLLLIFGVIAIAALVLRFTYVSSVQDETRAAMAARMDKAAQAAQLAQQSINLPNNPQLTESRSAITEELIGAKQEIQKWINEQAEEISKLAAVANQKDRVNKKNVPLLNGEPIDGFLPTIQPGRDAHTLKPRYDHVFDTWLALLLYNTKPSHGRNYDLDGSAPIAQDITNEIARQSAAEAASAPRPAWGPSAAPTAVTFSKAETDRRTGQILAAKAAQIRMYVNRSSFQVRGWYNSPTAPNENQIFEGIFDCWLQQDVVRAINAMNAESTSVLKSPVKRLEKIAVGVQQVNSARTAAPNYAPGSLVGGPGAAGLTADGGILFLGQAAPVAAPNTTPTQLPPPTAQAGALDYTKSVTGRVGSDKWDVTLMNIVVHIDPSSLNQFLSKLYQQNNSYTVLEVKLESIDPYEAASNGYIYGNTPVVRADILVESLMFRNWTARVMPEAYRTVLRIPDPQAQDAAAKQQAGY